jgi:hypothetical protein
MEYKKATDVLFSGTKHKELAQELGVSVASIRQARLGSHAKSSREPPPKWQKGVLNVAESQVRKYMNLIEELANEI